MLKFPANIKEFNQFWLQASAFKFKSVNVKGPLTILVSQEDNIIDIETATVTLNLKKEHSVINKYNLIFKII